jgi:glutamate 5-kinase
VSELIRQEISAAAERIVVKVGTRVLTHADGRLNEQRIERLAEDINALCDAGRQVVLVSSGAVGAGMSQLGLQSRPTDLAVLQAVAAVGQTNLIETYDRTFRRHNRHAAQILLTADDLNHRTRYLNVRNTLNTLLRFGAVPIINENDTVAVDELMTTFGDNDRLAALVTNLLPASLLVILSDVEGLYDGDPANPASQLIPLVAQMDDSLRALVVDKKTGLSKGGMASKARIVTSAGENVIIACGRRDGVLAEILAGHSIGTLLLAQGRLVSPWKRWLGYSVRPCGRLQLDRGAVRAITEQGRSLLAIGVVAAEGEFGKGDVVSLCGEDGREIARGLTNYNVNDVQRIKGLRSDQIADTLGHRPYEEVVHRDNLAVVEG